MPTPDLEEFETIEETDALRQALRNTQARLTKAKAKTDELVTATVEGAKEAMLAHGPTPKVPAPARDRRQKKAEVALWHLTDWQGSKVTVSYNSDVMRQRVMTFCDKAEQLTLVQRADHPVRDCVILFGGDLIEGLFNFPQQPYQVDATLFLQFTTATRLVIDVVRRALAIYDQVRVIAEWGNHGRVGDKRAAVPSSDNFDRMIQWTASEILAASGQRRLEWEQTPDDIQHVEIGNYRALLIHGDEIGRNGYASPRTIVEACARWKSGAHHWPFQDVYMGHFHTSCEWALPDGHGTLYQTGSPESDNRYANVNMAAAAVGSQRLHFIEPERGRVTAQYKVWLDA